MESRQCHFHDSQNNERTTVFQCLSLQRNLGNEKSIGTPNGNPNYFLESELCKMDQETTNQDISRNIITDDRHYYPDGDNMCR